MDTFLLIYYKPQLPIVIQSVATISAVNAESAKDIFCQDKHLAESTKDYILVTPISRVKNRHYFEDDIKSSLKF
jgi:hypothetical protein